MGAAYREELQRFELLLGGYLTPESRSEAGFISSISLARYFSENFLEAGYNVSAINKISLRVLAIVLLGTLLALVLFSIIPILVVLVVLAVEVWIVKRDIQKRIYLFEKDYTALLLSLASGIRTGLDPLAALLGMSELFPNSTEMHKELKGLKERIEAGDTEEEGIRSFAKTIRHPDLPLFRAAFILARREGSSLGECLQRLARVTRQRQSFRRKIRSAIAMQKLSAIGIGLSACAIGVVQALSNPTALQQALAHPVGVKLLGLGMLLIVSGICWMMKMAATKV